MLGSQARRRRVADSLRNRGLRRQPGLVSHHTAMRSQRLLGRASANWLALALAIAVTTVALATRARSWHSLTDLAVYRRGAGYILNSTSLYADHPGLPFTYPPFSAVIFVPLELIGRVPAIATIIALNLAAYALFVTVLARPLKLTGIKLAIALVVGFAFEPVWHTITFGQVNLLLAALIVADVFLLKPQHRGFAVGIAAGIKIVPGIFVLYYLLRRDWPSVFRSAAGFGVSLVVGAIFAPQDSWLYWTKLFFNSDHIGGVAYVSNQSLYGGLIRILRTEHPPTVIFLALALAAIALGLAAAARQLSRGDNVAALVSIALAALLASPVSWTHHWVWLVPAAMVLYAHRHRVGAALLAATAIVAPMWFTPSTNFREFEHTWWQAALCLSYAICAVLFLARMATEPRPLRTGQPALVRRYRSSSSGASQP